MTYIKYFFFFNNRFRKNKIRYKINHIGAAPVQDSYYIIIVEPWWLCLWNWRVVGGPRARRRLYVAADT